jgi:DNA-binding winged helix-turn-helix (wHTH) protein
MIQMRPIFFPPFRLDPINERLLRDQEAIPLRPKSFAVLQYLAERPNKLVRKEELIEAVWPETYVTDTLLKGCVTEIRKALGDDPVAPRFIETAHRRGYRFIAPIAEEDGAQRQVNISGRFVAPLRLRLSPAPCLVGREAGFAQLERQLERALEGERQVVFITGEVGIGKTALVESFLLRAARDPEIWLAHGQCLEQYGAGEAYLPVLEAFSRLCQEPGREALLELLRRRAPSWLRQMPWLAPADETEESGRDAIGATRERMLREMAEAVEALTDKTPLVLALEDLHWSDYSTLDLVSYLARRSERARLLLVGTYRPMEATLQEHPLKGVKQELQAKRLCEELPLGRLSEESVGEYLSTRFPRSPLPVGLTPLIHQRSEGNPLFLVSAVDYLQAEGLIGESEGRWRLRVELAEIEIDAPESMRQMIEKQIDRLSSDQRRAVEAASVAGAEFSVATVAAGLEEDLIRIEEMFEELSRRHQFIEAAGIVELSDGSVTSRYKFIHALYRNVLYDRIAAARRSLLHQRIAERGEAVYGARAGEIAAELAMHFERGRDCRKAVKYLLLAAENAAGRFANREVVTLTRRGLELIKMLPDGPERAQRELMLRSALGAPLMATIGYGAPEAEENYSRARELCQQLGESVQLLPALMGLCTFYVMRADLRTARELAEQVLRVASSDQSSGLLIESRWVMGSILLQLGEFAAARDLFERGIALSDERDRSFRTLHHPAIACRCGNSWALWHLGYPDQAIDKIQEAIDMAGKLSHPQSMAFAHVFAARQRHLRRETEKTLESAEAAIAFSIEQGLPQTLAWGTVMRGWALADRGNARKSIAQILESLAALRAMGAEVGRPTFLAMLAEAYQKTGQTDEAFAALDEALVDIEISGERRDEAEIYRIKGELSLINGAQTEAEGCFRQAIDIARKQQAKSWELRAAISLARLHQSQGAKEQARQALEEILDWFTEGFGTADLIEAREIVAALS